MNGELTVLSLFIFVCRIRNHGIRKTFIVKYQCCHGFRRVEGKPGCTEGN